MSERALSRLCARYGVKADGFLPATTVLTYPTNKFRRVMRPQAPAQGFLPQGALHRVFLGDPQAFHKCHGALLPRSSASYHSSLHCRTFLGLEILQELLPTVCVGGGARALIGREVQLSRTLLRSLGWSGSTQFPYQAGLPKNPPIVLAVQHPRPHTPPSTPASTSRVPILLP